MPVPAGPADTDGVSLDDAKAILNIDLDDHEDDDELQDYVDVANEWVAKRVSDVTPRPVWQATRELIRHLWDTQRGPATGPLDATAVLRPGAHFSIPNRVSELLQPYLRTVTPRGSFPPVVPFDVYDWGRW